MQLSWEKFVCFLFALIIANHANTSDFLFIPAIADLKLDTVLSTLFHLEVCYHSVTSQIWLKYCTVGANQPLFTLKSAESRFLESGVGGVCSASSILAKPLYLFRANSVLAV